MIGFTESSWSLVFGLLLVCSLVSVSCTGPFYDSGSLDRRQQPNFPEHDWASIRPSQKFEWHDCYGSLKCARLIVPMDYANRHSNQTVTLAVTMLPARDRDNYLGPLFINPGVNALLKHLGSICSSVVKGPGASGVVHITVAAQDLQSYFGENYGIISWDTSGSIKPWEALTDEYIFNDRAQLAQSIQRYIYEHENCRNLLGLMVILEGVNSENHARDMNSILEATGQEKLRYYVMSYGTTIAVYFATLFTENVERIVSEVNFDVEKFHKGDVFHMLGDAVKHREYLYKRCAADTERPFHESSLEAVGGRIDRFLNDLRLRPHQNYLITYPRRITDAVARGQLDAFFRNMVVSGQSLMGGLATYESEEQMRSRENQFFWSSDPFGPDYRTSYREILAAGEVEDATMCADVGWSENLNLDELINEDERGRELTPSALYPLVWRVMCTGPTQPRKRFEGPFGGNTSFPILFVNSWDIVTLMENAFHNAEIFPGSPVVVLDSYGHGMTCYSRCIWHIVHAYFQNGTVPEHNTTCVDLIDLFWGDEYTTPPSQPWEPEEEDTRRKVRRNAWLDAFHRQPSLPHIF